MVPRLRKRGNLPRSKYVPGGRYFITTAVRARAPVFEDPVPRFILLRDLIITLVIKSASLITLAVLPDQVHMIIRISSVNTSEIMRSFKSNSSRNINRLIRPQDEFRWQRSFYDRLIRDEKELDKLGRYVLMNPEKHGVEGFTWFGGNKPGFSEEIKRDIIAFSELCKSTKSVPPAGQSGTLKKEIAALETKISNHVADVFRLMETAGLDLPI